MLVFVAPKRSSKGSLRATIFQPENTKVGLIIGRFFILDVPSDKTIGPINCSLQSDRRWLTLHL